MRNNLFVLMLVGLAAVLVLSCSEESSNGGAGPADTSEQPDQVNHGAETDTTGPHVVLAYPGGRGTQNACQVETRTPVVVAFSEPVDPTTVTPTTFDVSGSEGWLEVCGNVVVFKPRYHFTEAVAIQVTVGGQISDMAGNAMGDGYEFIFYTEVWPK